MFFSLFYYLFFGGGAPSLLSSFLVPAFQSIPWPLLVTLSLLFCMFLSCWSDPPHLLFSRAAADATKSANLSFSTTLRKQQTDVLSSIRNMCRYYVTGQWISSSVPRADSMRFTLGTHFLHPVRRRTVFCFCFLPTSTFSPRRYHAVFSLKLLVLIYKYMTKQWLFCFFSPHFFTSGQKHQFSRKLYLLFVFLDL